MRGVHEHQSCKHGSSVDEELTLEQRVTVVSPEVKPIIGGTIPLLHLWVGKLTDSWPQVESDEASIEYETATEEDSHCERDLLALIHWRADSFELDEGANPELKGCFYEEQDEAAPKDALDDPLV